MNIVQLITNQFGGDTINKLGAMLGESPARTQTALGAAIPTLLGGLTHMAGTPEGAQRLLGAVSQQSPDITKNFGSQVGSAEATSPNMLSNLLGGNMLGGITSVLGRFTGMNPTAVTGLLGTVSPLILGFLNKQKIDQNLDASGLASFLDGQKQNIAAAMPPGLSKAFGSIPGLSGFTQQAPAQEPAYAGASPSMAGTTTGAGRGEPARASSPGRWIFYLLILGLIIWALWGRSRRQAPATTGQPSSTLQNPAPAPTRATSQLTMGLQNNLSSAATTLGSVTDANSAQQATPQLAQIKDRIAALKPQYDQLPASTRSTVESALQPTIAKLKDLSAKARGIPGVGDQFKSTLDQLDSSFAGFDRTGTSPAVTNP